MNRAGTSALVYLVAGSALTAGAFAAYPLFLDQTHRGLLDEVPTIFVVQEKPAGDGGMSVDVQIESKEQPAELLLEDIDLSTASTPGATTYVGIEYTHEGFSFSYEPLDCTADTDDVPAAEIDTNPAAPVLEKAVRQGALTAMPEVTGDLTSIRLSEPVSQLKIRCELPDFGFTRESLANWNLYLPGVEALGIDRAAPPVVGYWVARDPSEYTVYVSQEPSEVLAQYFSWYERDQDSLARQGLFLTVTSPRLQQESAYRLFIAGALLGLGGGLLVAGIQFGFEARRRARETES
jgi:hypothetical protein